MVFSAVYAANLLELDKTSKSRSNDDSANVVVERVLCLVGKDKGLTSREDPISIFSPMTLPNIDAEAFIRRILKYSQCSIAFSVIAMTCLHEQEALNLKLRVHTMHNQFIRHHKVPVKKTNDYNYPYVHYRRVERNENNSYLRRLLSYVRASSSESNPFNRFDFGECYSNTYYARVGGIANCTQCFPKLLSKSVIWNGRGRGSSRYAQQVHQMKDKYTRKTGRSSHGFAFRVLTFQSLLASVASANVVDNIANHDRTAASSTSRSLTQMASKIAADVSQSNGIFLFLSFVIILQVILLCLGLRGHYDFGEGRQGRFYFAAGSRHTEHERLESETM